MPEYNDNTPWEKTLSYFVPMDTINRDHSGVLRKGKSIPDKIATYILNEHNHVTRTIKDSRVYPSPTHVRFRITVDGIRYRRFTYRRTNGGIEVISYVGIERKPKARA